MKNLLKNILFYITSFRNKLFQEEKLTKHSYTNSTSKVILSSTEHMTFTAQTEQKKILVKQKIEKIIKTCNNSDKLVEYIQENGTKVYRIKHADLLLKFINEEEGFICEYNGPFALYLNFITHSKLSLQTAPMFIMRNSEINYAYLLHCFYKWYSLKSGLTGFSYQTQRNFKKYLKNPNGAGISKLSVNEILDLQEAVARDKEATEFVLQLVQNKEGGTNVKNKITNDGSATI